MATHSTTDTICALSTPPGISAIALLRLSGSDSISICEKVFKAADPACKLSDQEANTVHFGSIEDKGEFIDEVLVTIFKSPRSYTGEDTVEISCHGSVYIQDQLLQVLIKVGARMARPGEFTERAFLNGKMDLSRAEAVADLIASHSKASHQVAVNQIRGGFAKDIQELREQLVNFASLVELELDFSEEDVEFADRTALNNLLEDVSSRLEKLSSSFSLGNAIKHGIPIAIAGAPNVGKSTLLNALVNEERSIVSDIPGTTRDFIEDNLNIDGILFRFIDTAGIRDAKDSIEGMGISRTYEKMSQAQVILYLFDGNEADPTTLATSLEALNQNGAQVIPVINKIDLGQEQALKEKFKAVENATFISAKEKTHIEALKTMLVHLAGVQELDRNETIVTNLRHYEALSKALKSVQAVKQGINNDIGTDLLAQDIRQALHYLGEITGEVTTDELLGNIFSRFCIGK